MYCDALTINLHLSAMFAKDKYQFRSKISSGVMTSLIRCSGGSRNKTGTGQVEGHQRQDNQYPTKGIFLILMYFDAHNSTIVVLPYLTLHCV